MPLFVVGNWDSSEGRSLQAAPMRRARYQHHAAGPDLRSTPDELRLVHATTVTTRHYLPFHPASHPLMARYKTFTSDNPEEGYTFIDSLLAACSPTASQQARRGDPRDAEAAKAGVEGDDRGKKFGAASTQVVIEEFLRGSSCRSSC